MNRATLLAVLIPILFAARCGAEDWPQWRGPDRDGVWHEPGVLKAIPAGGLMMKLDAAMPMAAVLWPQAKSPARRNFSNTSTPLIQGEFVFCVNKSGHFICLSAATDRRTPSILDLTSPAGNEPFQPA